MKRIWIQRPCFYWGYETPATGKFLSVLWMKQADPPYYHGKALRLRLRDRAVHFGLCRKAQQSFLRPVEKSAREISTWVS